MNQCYLYFSWFIKENHSGGSHFRFTKCEKWCIDDSLQRSLGGMSFIFYSVQKILRKESFWIHENSRALEDWLFVLVNTDKNVSSCTILTLSLCVWWMCVNDRPPCFSADDIFTPHSLFQCSKLCLQFILTQLWMCSCLFFQ